MGRFPFLSQRNDGFLLGKRVGRLSRSHERCGSVCTHQELQSIGVGTWLDYDHQSRMPRFGAFCGTSLSTASSFVFFYDKTPYAHLAQEHHLGRMQVVNALPRGSGSLLVMLRCSQPSPRLVRSSFSHSSICFSVPALLALFEATLHHQKRARTNCTPLLTTSAFALAGDTTPAVIKVLVGLIEVPLMGLTE